jgi:hypothetical protein
MRDSFSDRGFAASSRGFHAKRNILEYVQNGRFAALGSLVPLVFSWFSLSRSLGSCGARVVGSWRSRSWFVLVPLSWLVALVCGSLVVLVALSCGARSHAALVALVWLVVRAARGSRLSPSSALVWLVWCRSCSFVVRGRRSCSLFALVARVALSWRSWCRSRSWSAHVALSWLVVARSWLLSAHGALVFVRAALGSLVALTQRSWCRSRLVPKTATSADRFGRRSLLVF